MTQHFSRLIKRYDSIFYDAVAPLFIVLSRLRQRESIWHITRDMYIISVAVIEDFVVMSHFEEFDLTLTVITQILQRTENDMCGVKCRYGLRVSHPFPLFFFIFSMHEIREEQ